MNQSKPETAGNPVSWLTIERPGYLGKERDRVYDMWNREHGPGNWRLAYTWIGQVISRALALQIYEDAYYEFFRRNPDTASWLLSIAKDVYDTAPTNAGQLDYERQETPNNHIHDVAIRRSLLRMGRKFEGTRLVEVRWVGTEGYPVNPGVVPFHLPDCIAQEGATGNYTGKGMWWGRQTVEDFYQKNKVLQVCSLEK